MHHQPLGIVTAGVVREWQGGRVMLGCTRNPCGDRACQVTHETRSPRCRRCRPDAEYLLINDVYVVGAIEVGSICDLGSVW